MNKNKNRPKHLNLFKIHMPVMAVLSFSHRVSGVILSLLIPVALYMFSLSLENQQGFTAVKALFDLTLVKVALLAITWAIVLHFCAGIRFLFIDVGIGVDKPVARNTAWLAHGIAILSVVILAGTLL